MAMSPLYVLVLVASEVRAPERISERHVVRAMEYGLTWNSAFCEGIFELLRSNLHTFYAELPSPQGAKYRDGLRAEMVAVGRLLEELAGPAAMIEDFKAALKGLAAFVAAGGAFGRRCEDPAMARQARWVAELLG